MHVDIIKPNISTIKIYWNNCILIGASCNKSYVIYETRTNAIISVSYTHLDVYKRQTPYDPPTHPVLTKKTLEPAFVIRFWNCFA